MDAVAEGDMLGRRPGDVQFVRTLEVLGVPLFNIVAGSTRRPRHSPSGAVTGRVYWRYRLTSQGEGLPRQDERRVANPGYPETTSCVSVLIVSCGVSPRTTKEYCEVSENLIQSVAPHLAPPVSREPIRSATDTGAGAELAYHTLYQYLFADDDAE
jgi:hypothetical protein